ncbi:hypothetical protein, partial [Anaplasma phagocytophilum]|uniref:hypothetical protein n=1 Tax=Anaplasma phagocytophilum TaxID=948 RepID=UPI00201A60A5
AMDVIPLLPSTRSVLNLDPTYPSRSCAELDVLLKNRVFPSLALYAEKLSEGDPSAIARVTGDPLRGRADTRRLAQMLKNDRVLVQSHNDLSLQERGSAFIIPDFDPAKCEDEDNVCKAGIARARLAATLQNMIGDPHLHTGIVEAIVSMSDFDRRDIVKLCKELVCSTVLSKKCSVQVVDAGLRIIPDVGSDGTGTLRLYQHVLLAPTAWWTTKPISVHLVVRNDFILHRDISGALAFSITNVRFGLRTARSPVLDKTSMLLECNLSLLGFCCTVDVKPSEEGVYSARALHSMTAVQHLYGAAYSFPLVDPLANTRNVVESLSLLVRTGITAFLDLFGVDGIVSNPLLCFADSLHYVGDHVVTSETDLYALVRKNCPKYEGNFDGIISEVLFNSTGFWNLCRFLRRSIGPSLEITPLESARRDVSEVTASGPEGLFTTRPYL